MGADEILRMIEAVDPADSAKLDEIDARVFCFLPTPNGLPPMKFVRMFGDGYCFSAIPAGGREAPYALPNPRYTRSRDALKAIRPEGWIMGICFKIQANGYCAGLYRLSAENDIAEEHSEPLPTEELAELHAILQAIEYERMTARGE